MALVVPNASEVLLLQRLLNVNQSSTVVLKLFKNSLTPSATTVIGDITEVTHTGYAGITLTDTNWVIATDAGGSATASYAEQTFTFSSYTVGVDVYGYYITDPSNNLLWVERFSSAPFAIPTAGGQIAITSTISLENI